MFLLLSEHTYVEFGDRVAARRPDVQFIRMHPDGQLRLGDHTVTWEERGAGRHVAHRRPLRLGRACCAQVPPPHGAQRRAPRGCRAQAPAPTIRCSRCCWTEGLDFTTSHVTGVPIAEFVVRSVLEHYQQAAVWAQPARATANGSRTTSGRCRERPGWWWASVTSATRSPRRAQGFGATVLGVRRSPDRARAAGRVRRAGAPSTTSFLRADVIVLAAPGGPSTQNLFDAHPRLGLMRERSVLVNVGRGSLVDEDALRRAALDGRRPGGGDPRRDGGRAPAPDTSWLWDPPASRPVTAHVRRCPRRYPRGPLDAFVENLFALEEG